MTVIKSFLKSIEKYILPYTCILCQLPSDQEQDLCTFCQQDLPWIRHHCFQCGEKLPAESDHRKCGICISMPPPFDRTISLLEYKIPVLALINQLKFHQKLVYARVFSQLLLIKLQQVYQDQPLPQYIIPVPLHKKRLQQRGYNQSVALAKHIAQQLHIPLILNCCQKIKATPAQSSLSAVERKKNLRRVFKVNPNFKAKHIALIDDVMTTGSTFVSLSKVFKKQGVETIDVWCIARALKT